MLNPEKYLERTENNTRKKEVFDLESLVMEYKKSLSDSTWEQEGSLNFLVPVNTDNSHSIKIEYDSVISEPFMDFINNFNNEELKNKKNMDRIIVVKNSQ